MENRYIMGKRVRRKGKRRNDHHENTILKVFRRKINLYGRCVIHVRVPNDTSDTFEPTDEGKIFLPD